MKKKNDRVLQTIKKSIESGNVMLVSSDENNGVNILLNGNCEEITKALFTATCSAANPKVANEVYKMIKCVAANIIIHPSPMSNDFKELMKELIEEHER